MDYFMNGRDRRQRGNRDDVMAPHNTYPCAGEDKWIAIAVGIAIGMGSAMRRDGKSGLDARCKVRRPVRRVGVTATSSMLTSRDGREVTSTSRWRNELQRAGVAAGPVLDSVEIHDDPHLWEWGFFRKINHREVGERILPNMPVRMSNVAELNYSMPPDLGQHNREIFGGLLGLSDAEIKMLMEQKVIY